MMGLALLTERHAEQIAGVLSCYDRVIVQGTLPVFCYADGMTAYLTKRRIRIFDFTQFAKPPTDAIKANAEALAAANGLNIDYVRKKNFRKEDRVKAVLQERGTQPGLVWIFSALEPCTTYQPWHDKQTHRTYLRPDSGKCLHYYFYFIDAELGLVYLRVPTWARLAQGSVRRSRMEWQGEGPFRLQFYCNGHSWLARQLTAAGVRLHRRRQCLRTDRRLAARAGTGGCVLTRPAAPRTRPLCRAMLPGARGVPPDLPLEPDAGGIRYQSGVPFHRHAWADV